MKHEFPPGFKGKGTFSPLNNVTTNTVEKDNSQQTKPMPKENFNYGIVITLYIY